MACEHLITYLDCQTDMHAMATQIAEGLNSKRGNPFSSLLSSGTCCRSGRLPPRSRHMHALQCWLCAWMMPNTASF